MSDSESLTVEDLRTKLYSSLHKKGLVDSMKSQLRSKLVTELRQISIGEPLSLKPSQTYDDDKVTLLQRAANSVVVDHLRHCHYDYSLSVFLPESGITHAKVFTMRDLLQLLSISPSSTLHKSLTQKIASSDSKKGFLWELLTELSRSKGRCTQDIGTQSDVQILTSQSLDDKFKEIDDYFATRLDDTKVRGLAIEERILSYQRQMEERSRSDVKLELARYKETELTRVRFEEREKCRSELEKSRNQLEQTYQAKLEGVISRERNATERIQKQQEIQEKEVVAQRQSTLDQIELVRQRENDVRRQLELFNREKKLLEDKMKSREELARQRENINKKNEMEYEQRLRDTTQRYKLDIQTQLSEKQQDIEIRELRVKENEIRVGDDMRDIGDVKNELRVKRKQVHELEAELQKSKHECIGAQQQVDMLNEKLRGMVDYQIIKQENAVMKHELDDVKMRLAEGQRDMMLERQKHEELLREMGERASRPTPEMLLLQQELERTKAALRQEQNMGIQQRRHAQHRIHQEMAMNSNLVKEYEKQDAEHREMSVHMKDLQSHLNHTQRVLHNEAYRTAPTITNPDRSLSLCDLDQGGHDGIIDDLLSQDLPSVLHRGDLECAHPSDLQQSDDYSYSSDIVKETRRRLQSLEKEADHLEQNYRNFQYNLTSDIGLAQDPLLPKNTQKLLETRSKGQSNSYHSTRPQSSTPHSAHQFSLPPSSGHLLATQDHRSPPRMDVSISTVNSDSPADQMGRTTTVTQNRTMRMEDLEARPGSPSIMVVEQTNISQPLPPIEREPAPIMSLDNAWKSEVKQKDNLEEMRLQQEREDREFEERMQRKEEERQKRQREAAAREEEELSRMRGETPAPPVELAQTASETVEPVQAAAESDIDPVMLSYMKKVREQKQHEKQEPKVIKKTLDTWNRHRTISQSEQTQSQSDDISAAEVASASVEEDNDDFEGW